MSLFRRITEEIGETLHIAEFGWQGSETNFQRTEFRSNTLDSLDRIRVARQDIPEERRSDIIVKARSYKELVMLADTVTPD